MEENNSLDQLVNEQSIDSQTPVNRPRLRKIKRPKIRPSSDTLTPPEKVFDNKSKEDLLTISNDEEVKPVENSVSQGTDLITSRDVQDIINERQAPNPYVLESLPPDFSTDEIFEESDNDDFPVVDEKKIRMKLFLFSLAFFLIGILFQAIFFSSSVEEKYGLEGVVLNQDVPSGRPRCGLTEKTQACVFYLMNCYKQELTGRDFYKLAAQLTSREEYMIETANLHYATVKINPGHFAQINIPAIE